MKSPHRMLIFKSRSLCKLNLVWAYKVQEGTTVKNQRIKSATII